VHVTKTIETPEGNVTFDGELSQDEVDLVITTGLNYLLARGALPFQMMNDKNKASIIINDSEIPS